MPKGGRNAQGQPQQICLRFSFPAIFPGSATLVEEHKSKKKQHGLDGTTRGREADGLDAAGAAIGSIWSHCICGRCRAAYASSVDFAGDDLRHARLAHNLGCDLVSAEDARGAQRASRVPHSRGTYREPSARERVTRRCDLQRAALCLRALLNFSAHVPPFPPRVHALWPEPSRGPSSNRLP
jgi:hypothetical protein